MTIKFLDNKIRTFKIFIVVAFHENQRFWTILLSARPTPLKNANFTFIVVSPSLTIKGPSP